MSYYTRSPLALACALSGRTLVLCTRDPPRRRRAWWRRLFGVWAKGVIR